MLTLEKALARLPAERRKKVEENGKTLIEQERALRRLREARRYTQKTLADALRVDQARISKIESASDLMLSTLKNYVEAMGGSLRLVAKFPDGCVEFSSLSEAMPLPAAKKTKLRPRRHLA